MPYQLIALVLQVLGPLVIHIPAPHLRLSFSLTTRSAFPRRLRIQVSRQFALRAHVLIPWVEPCAVATPARGLLITRQGSFLCASLPVLLFEQTACVGVSTGGAAVACTAGAPCCRLRGGILVRWDLEGNIKKDSSRGVMGTGRYIMQVCAAFYIRSFFLMHS